jgi:hypothetical protein
MEGEAPAAKEILSIQMNPAEVATLDWNTNPDIKVEEASPKLDKGIEMRVHVLMAGAEGKLMALPMAVPAEPYSFTDMADALLALVPPLT